MKCPGDTSRSPWKSRPCSVLPLKKVVAIELQNWNVNIYAPIIINKTKQKKISIKPTEKKDSVCNQWVEMRMAVVASYNRSVSTSCTASCFFVFVKKRHSGESLGAVFALILFHIWMSLQMGSEVGSICKCSVAMRAWKGLLSLKTQEENNNSMNFQR